MRSKLRSLLLVCALAGGGSASGALAAEPVDAFLAALRAHKYYDEALDYLDLLPSNPHIPDDVLKRLPYERAVTLLASAAEQSDPLRRKPRLAKATELLEAFCRDQPNHRLAGSARNQLASVLVERARGEMLAAKSDAEESAVVHARKLFEQARGQFQSAASDLDSQLGQLPKLVARDDADSQAHKRQLSADLAQARLMLASIDFELAKSYAPNSDEAKRHFASAAKSYAALHEAYRTRAAGLLARLWEGRCYQELGEFNQALGCYRELMDLPDAPETRAIRAKSTRQALECWTHAQVKNFQAAIERGERWETESDAEATDADDLAIRYLTAVAYQEQAEALPEKDPNRKRLAGVARQYVDPVARHPGEYQRPAKMLLVALSGGRGTKTADTPPQTFTEAYERAQSALERMQETALALNNARQQGDAQSAASLEQQKRESSEQAIDELRQAIDLRTSETSIEELNAARYYLCYLSWDLGRYYDAAVLGEFLADRYPESVPGRQGARLALAAWVRLYGESEETDKSFEVSQIQRVAELTFRRWPDQEEAEDAALTLVNFAAAGQQVEKAIEYLDKISPDSPRRAQAELRAGQALWSAYLRAVRLPDEERPPRDKLAALEKQAQEILKQGIGRSEKSGPVDATLVTAVFSLAQINIETGKPGEAIAWLNNERYGPLALVKAGHAATAREGFAVETYKLALRAYIAVSPQQVDKAEEAMKALEKLAQAKGDAKAADNLTAIYISLGRELQESLQDLQKSGNAKEVDNVRRAFEGFLDRVVERDLGENLSTLNWVGETYYGLGMGLDDGSAVGSGSEDYFRKAATAYQRLLAAAAKDPRYQKQPDALLGMRLRLADCYRRAGNFDEATQTVSAVLKEKPSLLTAQVQAAEIYQDRGATDRDGYFKAIMGGAPGRDGQNLIWGWAKISRMTMNNPQFQETFHAARLAIIESRYRYAMAEKDEARRKKLLEAAVGDARSTYNSRPDLGGEATAARYDRALKQVQKALGRKEIGLDEFKGRDAQSAAK